MWKVYKWNGHYIQGDLVSKHSSESAAKKAAKKSVGHSREEKDEDKEEITIWLDDEDGKPIGCIVHTKPKRKKKKDE